MSLFQFETTADIDGFIKIPDELKSQATGPLSVIVQQLPSKAENRPSIKKMIKAGIFQIEHEFIPLTREEAHER